MPLGAQPAPDLDMKTIHILMGLSTLANTNMHRTYKLFEESVL
jgi:hypothetical protein